MREIRRGQEQRKSRTAAGVAAIAAAMILSAALYGCGASTSSSSATAELASDRAYGTSYTTAESADESSGFAEAAAMDSGSDGGDSAGTDNNSGDAASGSDAAAQAVSASDTAQDIRKKIVYTGNVYIETKDYDTARSQLSSLIGRYGGFVESSNESDYGSVDEAGTRSYYVTAKIPSEHFSDFMNGLGNLSGKVTSKDINSSDMTRTYSDNADRIEALETEQQTLLELLAKADSVDSMIAIQKELTDVRTELAQLHHENSGIDYNVQYSSVTISLEEVRTYTPEQIGFAERLRDAFGGSGEAFIHFLQGLLIVIIYLIPYIVIALVIFLIVRKIVKKKRAAKAAGTGRKKSGRKNRGNPVPESEESTGADKTDSGSGNGAASGQAGRISVKNENKENPGHGNGS